VEKSWGKFDIACMSCIGIFVSPTLNWRSEPRILASSWWQPRTSASVNSRVSGVSPAFSHSPRSVL